MGEAVVQVARWVGGGTANRAYEMVSYAAHLVRRLCSGPLGWWGKPQSKLRVGLVGKRRTVRTRW